MNMISSVEEKPVAYRELIDTKMYELDPELATIFKEEGDAYQGKYRRRTFCLLRNCMGCRCGYVILSEFESKRYGSRRYNNIPCHGGCTWGGGIPIVTDGGLITTNYALGFDTAHSGDRFPFKFKEERTYTKYFTETYRTKEYCIEQCKGMIDYILSYGRKNKCKKQ